MIKCQKCEKRSLFELSGNALRAGWILKDSQWMCKECQGVRQIRFEFPEVKRYAR